jgi:hypothetical protein
LADGLSEESDGSVEPQFHHMAALDLLDDIDQPLIGPGLHAD